MREILFRGKSKRHGEWLYGCLFVDEEGNAAIAPITGRGKASAFEPVIPETVGQYTGVDDISGNKIFGGDVVIKSWHGEWEEGLYFVLFDVADGCWVIEDFDKEVFPLICDREEYKIVDRIH